MVSKTALKGGRSIAALRGAVAGLALACAGGTAMAGGVERTPQSLAILFEEGRIAEFTLGYVSPDVSGTAFGRSSGDMTPGYFMPGFAVKFALSPQIDAAIIYDQPFGADTDYGLGTGYVLGGTIAQLRSDALTGVLRYRFDGGFSVLGGLRVMRTSGNATVQTPALRYEMETDKATDVGWLVGVAWERPDIAARVSLTYNSRIRHDFAAIERLPFGTFQTEFRTDFPESVNLEFQTGIAPDTLLFGAIRWVRWSQFEIAPRIYAQPPIGDRLAFYDSNTVTYSLGLGRRFTESWSGALTALHEPRTGDPMGNLGPYDGRNSLGAALSWTDGTVTVTGGLQYIEIGRTTTRNVNADFRSNSGWAGGVRVAYRF
jgi:long-subunit fatty acid transport protein